MRKFCVAAVCISLCVLLANRPADALTEFRKAFEQKYAKDNADANEDFKKAVKTAACNVCHVKGKKKEERNAYGNALAELIEGSAKERVAAAQGAAAKKAEKEKLVKELEAAFEQVEKMKVDPEKEDSETFGERLHANKLPVDLPTGNDAAEDEEEEEE